MAYRTKICERGGIFNASRPTAYSAETREFLNDLIKESRLTMLQRKTLEDRLRSGGGASNAAPMPPSARKSAAADDPIKRYRSTRPRTLKDIVESGAYEPDAYEPKTRLKNNDAEKEKLQSIMTYGKVTKLDPVEFRKRSAAKKTSKECTEQELIDAVISEIEDREKFLADMEMLGQGTKYSASITHEIRDRIKKLDAFFEKTPCDYRKTDVHEIGNKYRKPFGTRKTVWITERNSSTTDIDRLK